MTLTATADALDGAPIVARARPGAAVVVEHVTVAVALGWWAFPLTYSGGGRDRWVLTIGLLLAAVAVVTTRAWRSTSPVALVVACLVGALPMVICLVDPTHWLAATQAATYPYGVALFLTVRSYGTTADRRTWMLGLVLAAAVAQFAWGFVAWHTMGYPDARMVGRFFWHNQFAAFLLVPAVVGVGLAVEGTSRLRLVGAVTAVLASTGVVLSTSRATMALLAVGWLGAGVLAVAATSSSRARYAAGARWAGLAATTGAVMYLLPGPPFFDHRVTPWAATAARAVGEPVGTNGVYRTEFWRQAVQVFERHPLTGGGFGSFGRLSRLVDPQGAHANFVHNGFLQAFTDGGLLLGLPVIVACLMVLVGLAARLRPRSWGTGQNAVASLALGSMLLAVHGAVDFDWSYPSLMALAAVLAALALPGRSTDSEATARSVVATNTGRIAVGVLVVASLVLAQRAVPGVWLKITSANPAASALGAPVS